MVRMYVRRVIFKKLWELKWTFLFSLEYSKQLYKEFERREQYGHGHMVIPWYLVPWYHGTSTNGTGTLYHKNQIQNKNAHHIILYSSYAYSNLSSPKIKSWCKQKRITDKLRT